MDNGVKAEKAGTALKNLMTNMIQPTEKQIACIQKYNLETAQQLMQEGKLIDSIKEIKKQTEGLSASEKAQIAVTIAGKEALSGVSALLNTNTQRITQLKFAVDSSTKSGRMYAETLGLVDEKGNVLIKDFNNMTDSQQKAYKQWENFNSIMEECGDTATFVGASTTDLGAIIHKLGEDGEVTAEQVNNVLDVFDKIRNTTKEGASALKEYGIEVKYAEDGSVNFGETLKNVGAKWDTLTDAQKKNLAQQLGLKGSTKELDELFANNGETIEELIDAYEKAEGVSEHLAETFDATLKGSMMNLASAIEERLLQAFDKMKPAVQEAINVLTEFFDIWNTKGLDGALDYLVQQSERLGEAIKTGLVNAISSIDDFINGGNFDKILQIGTNIIDGICKGIMEAKDNGTLDSAIDGFITKICDWIELNGPKVEEAGKTILDSIKNGISRNQDKLSSALDTLYSVINTWIQGKKGIIQESAIAMGTSVIKGIAIGLVQDAVGAIGSGFAFLVTTIGGCVAEAGATMIELGKSLISKFMEGWLGKEDWAKVKTEFGELIDWVMNLDEALPGESTTKAQDAGMNTGKKYGDGVDQGLKESKEKTDTTSSEIGNGISQYIGEGLASMDTTQLQTLQTELTNVGTTTAEVATSMATSFTSIQDSARTSFMGFANIVRNQLLNVSNIVRNQMLNCTSIVKNQATNMANAVRTQFVNMANIARNQFVNIANICRNQMVNCTNIVRNQMVNQCNIVRNQCVNMANIFRNQFVNMANICRNQMLNCTNIVRNQATNMSNALRSGLANMASSAQSAMNRVLSVIRSAMAQAKSIASQPITINIKSNISRTVTTSHVAGGLKQTMANISRNMTNVQAPSGGRNVMSSGSVIGGGMTSGSSALALEVPLYLDGKEIARATAKYNQAELDRLSKRNARKRGE